MVIKLVDYEAGKGGEEPGSDGSIHRFDAEVLRKGASLCSKETTDQISIRKDRACTYTQSGI